MKHLLIILSLLLLSSFLVSCEKKNGQGTYTFPDGGKYLGGTENGKANGQGTETSPDGRKYVGEFKNGERWNGTQYDKDGNITKKYVNGEQIKQ